MIRLFCQPGIDEILITDPTYGMYKVSAQINDIRVVKVPLQSDFSLNIDDLLNMVHEKIKLIILCSPNNPTGNTIPREDILKITSEFDGIVIVDEAYIDFSKAPSLIDDINDFPNLVVMQSLSKSWGLAGLRIGLAFGNPDIIDWLNKIKPPYNIPVTSQEYSKVIIGNSMNTFQDTIDEILNNKNWLVKQLLKLSIVEKIYPSDANFLLVKMKNSNLAYDFLLKDKIIVRDRSKELHCANCLRITVGDSIQNKHLINTLSKLK